MAIRAWKSVNEEVYTNFCKRIDAVAKGGITVLTDKSMTAIRLAKGLSWLRISSTRDEAGYNLKK